MHRESLTIPLPEATLTQMVRDLVRSSLNTEDQLNHIQEGITAMSEQITELRTAIASEVAEAITQAETRIADALAAAGASEEARAAAVAELETLRSEISQVTADVQAAGLYGQEQPVEEPETPAEPVTEEPAPVEEPTEPEAPVDPETPSEPVADEPVTEEPEPAPVEPTNPEAPASWY